MGSTLADRLRLAGVVATLALANLSLGLADAQQTASAAIAVFVFNILYEVGIYLQGLGSGLGWDSGMGACRVGARVV